MIFYWKYTIILLLSEKMASLDQEITLLKEQIQRYEAEHNTSSSEAIKDRPLQTINSARETLNRLLDEKKAQSRSN